MPEDRYHAVRHAIALWRLLETPHTYTEAGQALGLHPRTIRRLLDTMRASGLQVTVSQRPTPADQCGGTGPVAYQRRGRW